MTGCCGGWAVDTGRGTSRRRSPRLATAGIGSVSLDLLYDVPGQGEETWAATLDAALALSPDHVSAYALTLDDPDAEGLTGPAGDHLPTQAGARRWRTKAIDEQDDDRAAAQYDIVVERLAAAGFRGYEISNWARPGHESRHNLAYWERRPYEAVGPGAHAFDGASRRWNAARLDGYLAALAPADGSEPTAAARRSRGGRCGGGPGRGDDPRAAARHRDRPRRRRVRAARRRISRGRWMPASSSRSRVRSPASASPPAAASSRTSCSAASCEQAATSFRVDTRHPLP